MEIYQEQRRRRKNLKVLKSDRFGMEILKGYTKGLTKTQNR